MWQNTASHAADKSDLTQAITDANNAKAGVIVSEDGTNVTSGTKWVTQDVMDALNTAIANAEAVRDNSSATQAEVDAAEQALENAINAFNSVKSDGTKGDDTGSVGGLVSNEDGGVLAGITVKVMHGGTNGTLIAETTTAGSGEYHFAGLPYGVYSLVAEYNGVTVTKLIIVDRDSITQNITMPSGNRHTVVDVVPGTPSTAADNLDEMFTPGDHAIVDGGGSVQITLKVEQRSGASLPNGHAALIEAAAGNMSVGLHLDLALLKTITGTGAQDVTDHPITQTGTKLTVVLELPEALWGKASYSIIRVHDGVAETLAATYDPTFHTLTFQTDRFSSYAVAYTESDGNPTQPTTPPTTPTTPAPTPTPIAVGTTLAGSPQTGDTSNMLGWIVILAVSVAGLAVLAVWQKRKQTDKQ